MGTDLDFSISAGAEQGVRSSFDFRRRGGSATLTRRISRAVAISWRYGIEKTRLFTKSNFEAQPEIDRLFPDKRLSSVASSLIRDTRNDALEPTSGSLIGTDAELAARRAGVGCGLSQDVRAGIHVPAAAGCAGPGPRSRNAGRPGHRVHARGERPDHRRRNPAERAILRRRRFDPSAGSPSIDWDRSMPTASRSAGRASSC